MSSISFLPNSNTTDPQLLFKLSLRAAMDALSNFSHYPSKLRDNDPRVQNAINVCGTVLNDALGRFNDSISSLGGGGKLLPAALISDIETWLSAAITYQETYFDALPELNSTAASMILQDLKTVMKNSTEYASNSLAIVTRILGLLSNFNGPIHRRLLQESNTADEVVAKDGSGQYRMIKEALAAVEKRSEKRYVIYVKEGTYVEHIDLDMDIWNVIIKVLNLGCGLVAITSRLMKSNAIATIVLSRPHHVMRSEI